MGKRGKENKCGEVKTVVKPRKRKMTKTAHHMKLLEREGKQC
jgi:hypothetical protein